VFYCPIEPALHPRAASIEQRAIDWMDQTGLYRDERERAWGIATHAAELACRVLPTCPEDKAWLFGAWNYWSFALGDRLEDEREPSARSVADFTVHLLRTLEEPGYRPPGSRCGEALADLVDRTRGSTTTVQFRRLADGARDWLLAASWRAANAARHASPALDDFAAMVPSLAAVRFFAAWLEIAEGTEVPAKTRWASGVQALTSAAGFVVGCDNDLAGYLAGQAGASRGQNMLAVLMAHRHCSAAEAMTETISIRDRVMTRFLGLRNRLAKGATPGLRRYLKGLGHYVRGCLDWMNTAPRYGGPHRPQVLPMPGAGLNLAVSRFPADLATEPPGIAPIDRWWRL
jgi:hypothetical protein